MNDADIFIKVVEAAKTYIIENTDKKAILN